MGILSDRQFQYTSNYNQFNICVGQGWFYSYAVIVKESVWPSDLRCENGKRRVAGSIPGGDIFSNFLLFPVPHISVKLIQFNHLE